MDGDKTEITDIANSDVWAGWLNEISLWVNENLLSLDTLIELGLIFIAASLAWPVSIIVRKKILAQGEKFARYALLRRLWAVLGKLSFHIVWLGFQLIIVAVMNYLAYRHASLVITSSLLTAWILISVITVFVANPLLSLIISVSAWIVAALNIVGLLDNTITMLDGAVFSLGQVNISLLTAVQGLIALAVLLWVTAIAGQLIEGRIKSSPNLTPSIKVLSAKLMRILLAVVAIVFAL